MNNKTKMEIYAYLKKYINQKNEHSDYIDYYDLYGLDSSLSVDQIQSLLKEKKLRKLFHPDQIAYLDDDFKEVFKINVDEVIEVENVFSSESSKLKYDNLLDKKKKEQQRDDYTSNKDSVFTIQDEKDLERTIETTIYKYGFYQGYCALKRALKNDFSCITSDNNARNLAINLGSSKIKDILLSKKSDVMENDFDNVIMDYYSKLINKSGLKDQADIFYNACNETVIKYDILTNVPQLDFAVSRFIETGKKDGFTKQNSSRELLESSNIQQKDAHVLMCAKMHSISKENSDYKCSNFTSKKLDEQINLFASEVKKEAKKIVNSQKII